MGISNFALIVTAFMAFSRVGFGAMGANPVIDENIPDPSVLRVSVGESVKYYLVGTAHHSDIPLYVSSDLVGWTQQGYVFGGARSASAGGRPLTINGRRFCALWAPELRQIGPARFSVNFTAQELLPSQASCEHAVGGGTVFVAYAKKPEGPYALDAQEPLKVEPAKDCERSIKVELPRSRRSRKHQSCANEGECQRVLRLDGYPWWDPLEKKTWLFYSWGLPSTTASSEPGQYISAVEIEKKHHHRPRCEAGNVPFTVGDPYDPEVIPKLPDACEFCGDNFGMGESREGNTMIRNGRPWRITEGAGVFRRGEWVYLLMSGSGWPSPTYHVYWIAVRGGVRELADRSGKRISGRFLVPDQGNFGHGTPVLGPNGKRWYYVHHALENHAACKAHWRGCRRPVYVTPIEFEDRGDGLGEVWIRPVSPKRGERLRVR